MPVLNSSLIICLIGFVFILGFGALSYMRRQGLSSRFAVEGLIITGVGAVFSYTVVPINSLLFRLALRLVPDTPSRQIILINQGVTQLCMKAPEAAVASLEEALGCEGARLGAKYLAAGHYNLGLAYRRVGREAKAIRHFNQAIDAWPASLYAAHARAALEQSRRGGHDDENNAESD